MRKFLAFVLVVLASSTSHSQVQSFEQSEKQFHSQIIQKLEKDLQEKQLDYERLNSLKNTISELSEANKKILAQFDKENEKSYVGLRETRVEKAKAKKYLKQNADLLGKRGYVKVYKTKYLLKNEFETYKQFSDRAKKFIDKRNQLIKKNRDSIKELTKSIKSPWGKYLHKDVRSAKNKYDNSKELLSFAKTSSPAILAYKGIELVSLEYNAEKQVFKASLKIQASNGLRLKRYTLKIPLPEAESFKKNIESYNFAFMLGDLRAIILGEKIIKSEPTSTWYSKL